MALKRPSNASLPQPAPSSPLRYYTSPSRAGALHDDFRLLWDHVYRLTDQLADAHTQLAKFQSAPTASAATASPPGGTFHATPQQLAPPAAPPQGSPSNTSINGIRVKAVPPTNGQKLTYVAASGQIEWV